MSSNNLETIKLLIIGPSGAGKSALLIRYCDDQFDSESATTTIGVDVKVKKLSIRGKLYRINIHDTAGQERFRALPTSYYRGAHGIILVYDSSNWDNFSKIERSYEEALANERLASGAVTYLVGSQIDKKPTSKTYTKGHHSRRRSTCGKTWITVLRSQFQDRPQCAQAIYGHCG